MGIRRRGGAPESGIACNDNRGSGIDLEIVIADVIGYVPDIVDGLQLDLHGRVIQGRNHPGIGSIIGFIDSYRIIVRSSVGRIIESDRIGREPDIIGDASDVPEDIDIGTTLDFCATRTRIGDRRT